MDIKGKKVFVILGYRLYALGMFLFVTADFNMLLIALFLCGLANALQLNSYQMLMGDMIPRNLRGTANGRVHFFLYVIHAIPRL